MERQDASLLARDARPTSALHRGLIPAQLRLSGSLWRSRPEEARAADRSDRLHPAAHTNRSPCFVCRSSAACTADDRVRARATHAVTTILPTVVLRSPEPLSWCSSTLPAAAFVRVSSTLAGRSPPRKAVSRRIVVAASVGDGQADADPDRDLRRGFPICLAQAIQRTVHCGGSVHETVHEMPSVPAAPDNNANRQVSPCAARQSCRGTAFGC